jgi:hypothetical protein
MKHLRSSIEDMRRLFERGITVRDIAEPLVSFDDGQSALEVRNFLESKDYDVVGVRRKGMIEAYAIRSELGEASSVILRKQSNQKRNSLTPPRCFPSLNCYEIAVGCS